MRRRSGPPLAVRPEARGSRRRSYLPVLLAPPVIFSMAMALLFVEGKAQEAREASDRIGDTVLLIGELEVTTFEVLVAGGLDEIVGDEPSIGTQLSAVTAAIESLPLGPETVRAFSRFRDAILKTTEIRRSGDPDRAGIVATLELTPAWDALHASLLETQVVFEHHAASVESQKNVGALLTLVLGGSFLMMLGRRVETTRRRLSESQALALQASERRFASLMAGSSDVVTVLNREGTVQFQSGSVERMLGWRVADLMGHDIREFLDGADVDGVTGVLEQAEQRPDTRHAVEWKMRSADGTSVFVEALVAARLDDAEIDGFLLNIRDRSERIVLEDALRHQAFHDPLTKLPNRALFEDRLEHALGRTSRSGRSLCLLQVDLDDFKDINDTYGHAFGDEVLIAVADRLRRTLRSEDTVARLGGDEFAILIDEVASEHDGARAAQRIVDALDEPITIGTREVYAHGSIGIVTGSVADTTAGTDNPTGQLVIHADLAMYEAKRQGRGKYRFYAEAMQTGISERMAMRSDLARGLSRKEFFLHYQPIVSIARSAIVGAEALIRWQHPQRGLVPPLEFIPIAEQTGLILDIGRWVLKEACREAARWGSLTPGPAPYVSVNIAGQQLQETSFIDEVREALRESGIEPSRLVLEMTESALIEDTEGNVLKLQQLRELGVRLAIDDFGTGYSSLSYLRQFNLDILKIDKSFIDALGQEAKDVKGSALVAAMVSIGSSLGMKVVAEGIEETAQLQDLRALHCDEGQGYIFARPMAPADLEVIIAEPFPSAELESALAGE